MKSIYLCLLLVTQNIIALVAVGQTPSMPHVMTDAFAKMYPDAKEVEWHDKTDDFLVFFKMKGARCEAKFARDGNWISSEEGMSWDSLPMAVRDSVKLGKYGDWKQTSSYIVRLPGGNIQYHVVVAKPEMGRKILFFDKSGRLLTDHLSL